jgi:hypothetical protein
MEDRSFTELDLRGMVRLRRGITRMWLPGRWVIEVKRGRRPWEVIVEPDRALKIFAVITAYPA